MTDREIIEKLQIIVRDLAGDDDIILDDKTVFKDLGFNSFAQVQLICAIEDAFGIDIPNTAIKSVKNLSSAVKLIKRLIKNR